MYIALQSRLAFALGPIVTTSRLLRMGQGPLGQDKTFTEKKSSGYLTKSYR
jgi:hypothetical protein